MMNGPIEFYRTFQALLRGRAIEGLLTSGMACVEYGIQQTTKDTDWIIAPALIERLVTLFGELERGISGANWRISYRGLFGAPLDSEYLAGGWTSHLVAFELAESAGRHLDFFGRPPRAGEWPTAEPFLQQHERVCNAVRRHGLPPAPLGTVADRQAIYDRGLTRAAALVAATPQELETIAMPLDIILP
jgi:hypothetical protein